MAMRQRGAATNSRPRQSIRPTYEDFQPQFNLKEEPEAHFIYVQLPDFLKEQVRITFVHAPGVIRVHGQRPLGNNRWSRFNQTFPLPKNCPETKIHGKFNNGVLTITLPKEVVAKIDEAAAKPIQETKLKPAAAAAEAKPQKVSEDNKVVLKEKDQILAPPSQMPAVQPKVQKGQDPIYQTAIASATKDPQVAAPAPEVKAQKDLPLREGIAEMKQHNDKEDGVVSPSVVSSMTQNGKQRDEKRVIALSSVASDPKSQKGKDETPPKTMEKKAKKEVARYISEANEKPGEPAQTKKKEMSDERSTKAAVIERFATNTIDEAKKKSKCFGSGRVEQEKPQEDCVASKKGMKNVERWIYNEDKQLLINVGAAIVVLVAFGAYTTYNLWCSGKPKN